MPDRLPPVVTDPEGPEVKDPDGICPATLGWHNWPPMDKARGYHVCRYCGGRKP